MTDENFKKAMADFLAKGGVIQQAAYRESGRVEGAAPTNAWGAGKKAGRPPASAKSDSVDELEEDE